jgi:hypothetical protein
MNCWWLAYYCCFLGMNHFWSRMHFWCLGYSCYFFYVWVVFMCYMVNFWMRWVMNILMHWSVGVSRLTISCIKQY